MMTSSFVQRRTCSTSFALAEVKKYDILFLAKGEAGTLLRVIKQSSKMMLDKVDKEGNTFLHLAVLYQRPIVIQVILKALGRSAAVFCKKTNNAGYTPLLLVQKHEILFAGSMIDVLLPSTLNCSIKPLREYVDPNNTVEQCPQALSNLILADNLMMGALAINASRRDVFYSRTHPTLNNETRETKEGISIAIEQLRFSFRGKTLSMREIRHKIQFKGVGNCHEYAHLVLSYLMDRRKNRNIRFELIYFENDDHIFVMIDRASGSVLNNPETWGKNCVLVDAWSGNVFFASKEELNEKLKGYYQYSAYPKGKESFNCLRTFNSDYHKFVSLCDFYCNPLMTSSHLCLKTPPAPSKGNMISVSKADAEKIPVSLPSLFSKVSIAKDASDRSKNTDFRARY